MDLLADVTFSVDMSEEQVHSDGVWMAGGNFVVTRVTKCLILMVMEFGPLLFQLRKVDKSLGNMLTVLFLLIGRAAQEPDIQPCGSNNDRVFVVLTIKKSVSIPTVCFGSCYTCDYVAPVSDVAIQLDMNGLTVLKMVFTLLDQLGGEPNAGNQAGRLTDRNGDGVYEGTFEIITGSSFVLHLYKWSWLG